MSPAAPPLSVRATTRRLLSVLTPGLLFIGGLTACSDDPDPSTLPDGATLVSEAAVAMADLETLHMEVELDPPIGDVPLARADIDLTAKGEAQGEVQIEMGGQLVGVELKVIEDGTSFLKFPGLGWTESDLLAEVYDVSSILDPDRGIAKLLSTATAARTEGSERAGGADCWKVAVTLDAEVVERLVPAELPDEGLTGTIWVNKTDKRLMKAIIMAPATGGSSGSEITFTITAFNEPVTVSDPTG